MNRSNDLAGYAWEFNLVESKEVKAWCMPGTALGAALHSQPQQTQQLWMSAFGAGAQYGMLMPFGRGQESEADHLPTRIRSTCDLIGKGGFER